MGPDTGVPPGLLLNFMVGLKIFPPEMTLLKNILLFPVAVFFHNTYIRLFDTAAIRMSDTAVVLLNPKGGPKVRPPSVLFFITMNDLCRSESSSHNKYTFLPQAATLVLDSDGTSVLLVKLVIKLISLGIDILVSTIDLCELIPSSVQV